MDLFLFPFLAVASSKPFFGMADDIQQVAAVTYTENSQRKEHFSVSALPNCYTLAENINGSRSQSRNFENYKKFAR